MKSNAKKLKAKIKRAYEMKNPINMDVYGLQHLNKIHVLLKQCGIKLDKGYSKARNHIDEYKHYHYPSELEMGLSIHPHSKQYMVLNWRPSKGSKHERQHTSNLF